MLLSGPVVLVNHKLFLSCLSLLREANLSLSDRKYCCVAFLLKSLRPEKNGVCVEVVMLISELVVSVNVSDLSIISVVFSVLSFSRRCISPSSCASLIAVRLSGEHSFLASLTPRVWTGVGLL